ncbi:MAG: hypothetical protein KKI20_04095, partial [Gammaproteobacteria bacterium]|nr:hypothetical protein [Gammaproteobacteria bacterium]
MSLINTVLKDLEESQKRNEQNAQNDIPQGLSKGPDGKKRSKRFLSFIFIFGLLIILGFGIHFFWIAEPFAKKLQIAQ